MDSIFSLLDKDTARWVLDSGEWGLLISSLAVVIGIIGEWKKHSSLELHSWLPLFEALVLLGVTGELVSDGIIFVASSRLQSIQEAELSVAKTNAANAIDAAEKMGVSFGNLDQYVKNKSQEFKSAATELRQETKNLDSARNDAVAAANNAKTDIAKAEQILSREAAIRDQIIALNTPRTILPDKQNLFIQNVTPFAGIIVNVFMPAQNDADAAPLGTLIANLLNKAGWNVGSGTLGSGWAKSVLVCTGNHPSEKVTAGAQAIILALRSNGIQSHIDKQLGPNIPFSGFGTPRPNPDMTIIVGARW